MPQVQSLSALSPITITSVNTGGGPPVSPRAPIGGGGDGDTGGPRKHCHHLETQTVVAARPRFELLLEAAHDPTDGDGSRRLRGALKRLLRSFGLRCIRVEPVTKPVNTAMPRGAADRADAAIADVSSPALAAAVPVTGTSSRLSPREGR